MVIVLRNSFLFIVILSISILIFAIGFASTSNAQILNSIDASTDKSQYTIGETIFLNGNIAILIEGQPISLVITDPLDEVVTLDQIYPSSDGSFSAQFVTGQTYQYSGTYTVNVTYSYYSTKVQFEFVGTQDTLPTKTEGTILIKNTNSYADYTIYDATLLEVQASAARTSLTILLDAQKDGSISIIVPFDVIIMNILENNHTVLVDGIKTDKYGMSSNVGNYHSIDVGFSAGVKKIEILVLK